MARTMICSRCGEMSKPVRRAAIGFGAEVAAWAACVAAALLLGWWVMLAAIAVSVYRMVTSAHRCAGCGASELVPPDSPVGRELQARYAPPAVPRIQRRRRMSSSTSPVPK